MAPLQVSPSVGATRDYIQFIIFLMIMILNGAFAGFSICWCNTGLYSVYNISDDNDIERRLCRFLHLLVQHGTIFSL